MKTILQIWGNLWAILRNPDVFPKPEEFRPERFIQEDGTLHSHEQVINFGIGNLFSINKKKY